MQPDVGVAFIVREKFSWARRSLERLYAAAGMPFTLYRADHIDAGRYLYPNEALNRVIEEVAEPYLCVVQNDVMIEPNAVRHMVDTARTLACDLVAPRMWDAEGIRPKPHRQSGQPRRIRANGGDADIPCEFEMHCLLMTADTARAIYPLPPLSSREHIDLAMRLWRQGRTACLDMRANATYMGSPPERLHESDREYFDFRWDLEHAQWSHEYVTTTWGIADMEDAMPFARRQRRALRYGSPALQSPTIVHRWVSSTPQCTMVR